MSNKQELTKLESLVLSLICRYKIVSVNELAFHIKDQRDEDISDFKLDKVVNALERQHLIFMPVGGLPKRYAARSWMSSMQTIPEEAF